MTTPTNPGPRRRRMRPITSGAAGCVICAVALGALVTTHALPAGALASSATTADLLSIDHTTGTYFGGAGGVIAHRTPGGDVLDNLPSTVDVHAVESVGRDALGYDMVYAAGDHGALYYQAGGNAWCRIVLPTAAYSENLRAIASSGPGDVEIAGTDGLIMELTGPGGCGATFVVDHRVPGTATLNAIHHFANGLVVAAGDYGTMFLGHVDSTFHHLLFSQVVTQTLQNLYGVVPSSSGAVAVGGGGVVLGGSFSSDPKTLLPTLVTTVLNGIPTIESLRDVAAGYAGDPDSVPPAVLAAVGDAGTMIESLDGGVTWSVAATGTSADLHGVQLGSVSGGVADGNTGTVVTFSMAQPTPAPSSSATPAPTSTPTPAPSSTPTPAPSSTPTPAPTSTPTPAPSSTPTPDPSGTPTPAPTSTATPAPSSSPTPDPSSSPSPSPSGDPGTTSTTSSSTSSGGTGSGSGTSTSTTTVTSTVTSNSTATVEVTSVSTTTSTTTVSSGGGSGSSGGQSAPPPAPGTPAWAKRLVDELYLEVLGRNADSAGEAYWVDQVMGHGQGPVAIARSLLASYEYRANLVRSVYWQYLGRGGEDAGVNSWVAMLGNGMTDEQLRLAFLGTPEFWSNSGGNPKGFVDSLYQTVLQRGPDSSGEAYWVSRLNAGASPVSVAASLVYSFEQLEGRVSGYYLTFLARGASKDELAYWARGLAAGVRDEDIMLGFVGSTEFLSRI
ncbi:MAG: DUF4214 domain-containing protein [Chloroflexi bacterium]|nr:MAG: DUF4214 domain-containing protein [Chloroflexota bacterium]